MGKLIHTSKVKISKEPGKSKIKRAEIEGFPGAVRMGIHGGIAEYFKLSPDEPMASTLDYIVAAVGGCMTGTVAGALEARGVSANPDKLQVEAEGRIENVDGKMILTGIKLHYRLKVPKEKRATVERALEHHEGLCAASESVRRGITVEWDSEIVEETDAEAGGDSRGRDNCPPIKRAPSTCPPPAMQYGFVEAVPFTGNIHGEPSCEFRDGTGICLIGASRHRLFPGLAWTNWRGVVQRR